MASSTSKIILLVFISAIVGFILSIVLLGFALDIKFDEHFFEVLLVKIGQFFWWLLVQVMTFFEGLGLI